jgi:RNA polymerase sigma factor (sigma-70 family)
LENSKVLWDEFVTANYSYLLKVAGKFCTEPTDLVSHTYLRVIDKSFKEKPMGYFCTAMYVEATRGKFKQLYTLQDTPTPKEPVAEPGFERSVKLEQIELYIDRLQWFDRMIIRLYIDGHKLSEIAEESGIKPATLYQSLHRTKKLIADAIRKPAEKGRKA